MARTKRKTIPLTPEPFLFPAGPALEEAPASSQSFPVRSRVIGAARGYLDRFMALEAKVLKGDSPKSIHDMRVASRRLQQVLEVLYPEPPSAKIRKLRRSIRRCRKALSTVRNHDVLLARADRVLKRKKTYRREAWEAFRDYLEERRQRSFRKASRRLTQLNLPILYVRLRECLGALSGSGMMSEPVGKLTSSGDGDADAALGRRVEAALQKAWTSLQDSVRKSQEDRDAPALHAVRIAAKKIRYLIEVIHMLQAPGSDQALRTLRRVQRLLGDWQDREVLEEMMLKMVANTGMLEQQLELAMEAEKVVLQFRKRKKAYEKRFFQVIESSGEWDQLEIWVRGYRMVTAIGPARIVAHDYSAAFPPSSS